MTDYTKNASFTAKTGTTIEGADFDSEFDEIATAIASKENTANKGAANGYCGLGSGGLVDPSDLPAATESAIGAVELATTAEAAAGADTSRAVTAAGVAAALAAYSPTAQIVTKTVSETVTASAVFQNDDELTSSSLATGTYLVEVQGSGTFNASNGGVKFAWGGSATIRATNPDDNSAMWGNLIIDGTTTLPQNDGAGYPTSGIAFAVSTSPTSFSFRIVTKLVITSAGTINLNWAQRTATGSTRLDGGTFMMIRKIG